MKQTAYDYVTDCITDESFFASRKRQEFFLLTEASEWAPGTQRLPEASSSGVSITSLLGPNGYHLPKNRAKVDNEGNYSAEHTLPPDMPSCRAQGQAYHIFFRTQSYIIVFLRTRVPETQNNIS